MERLTCLVVSKVIHYAGFLVNIKLIKTCQFNILRKFCVLDFQLFMLLDTIFSSIYSNSDLKNKVVIYINKIGPINLQDTLMS